MALDDKTEQIFNVGRLSYTLDDARRMNYQKTNSLQNTILEIAKIKSHGRELSLLSVLKYVNQFHKFRNCWSPCGGRKHGNEALFPQTSQAVHLYRTHCV